MKLFIKERIFTWGDKFTVMDETGGEKYYVEGEVFSWGKKLHVYDRHGREAAFIKQEVFSWMPCYRVYVNGAEVAQVRRELTFFLPKYRVDGPGWEVKGDIFEHDYEITRNGSPVVTIQKEWMTWGDSYVLDIKEPADEISALAVVLTIDCIQERERD